MMKMRNNKWILTFLLVLATITGCQKDFLEKEPLGRGTQENIFNDETNAILAVNSIYDAASWDEGPKWGDPNGPYVGHMYEWMFGDVLSDDAEKGSTQSDFSELSALKEWRAEGTLGPIITLWSHCFTGINRANIVINNVDAGTISDELKARLKGEALFFRAYFYFYLVRTFGGVPLFDNTVNLTEVANIQRNSIAETYAFIEKDFTDAASLLPEKNGYGADDVGRATKGAANSFLARAILYQLGTDNTASHTWQEVYDLTASIINSGQYSLLTNYAQLHELEGENRDESIFEIQFSSSSVDFGPAKTGSTSNVFQNNRSTWGYGFNNPTQNLVDEFEANDPRLTCTIIKNNDIVLGILNPIDLGGNATGFLNRKAAILQPVAVKSGDQNIRKMRLADVLLMHAEAAAHIGDNAKAISILNQIRDRARVSSKPKGSVLASLTYAENNPPEGTLPVLNNLSGDALLNAIWHERRVELGMESLRFWDLVRTGRYLASLPESVRARCQSKCITSNVVNPVPLIPLPLNEVQTWGLTQNPGY